MQFSLTVFVFDRFCGVVLLESSGVKVLKLIWKQVLQSFALGVVIPGVLLSAFTHLQDRNSGDQDSATVTYAQSDETTDPAQQKDPLLIPIQLPNGSVEQMELEEYVSRVVLGEVPASFDIEALKAQAIAARTYTLRCFEAGDRHSHGGVCTDYHCCQAYRDPTDYLSEGGTKDDLAKIYFAVAQTRGQVLRYDGELICATYFANSGGSTEDAQAVWGQAYPYLKVVSSPEDENSAYYAETLEFSPAEIQQLLGQTLTGSPTSWFGNATYTVGGGVDMIRIGAKFYSGVEVRALFDLRSTIFSIDASEDVIVFHTKGYGHRVGLSQYGAEAMAAAGSSCEEILAHYYPSTCLEQYD